MNRYIGPAGTYMAADYGVNALIRRGTQVAARSATPSAMSALQNRVTALAATGTARWRTLSYKHPKLYRSIIAATGIAALTTSSGTAADLIADAIQAGNTTTLDAWTRQATDDIAEDNGLTRDKAANLVHNTGMESVENAMKSIDGFNSAIDIAHNEHNVSTDELPTKVKAFGQYPAINLLQQSMAQSDAQASGMRRLVRRAATNRARFWDRMYDEDEDYDDSPVTIAPLPKAPTTTASTTTVPTTTTAVTTTVAAAVETPSAQAHSQVFTDLFTTSKDADPTDDKDAARHRLVCQMVRNIGLSCTDDGTPELPKRVQRMHPAIIGVLSTMTALLITGTLLCACQLTKGCAQRLATPEQPSAIFHPPMNRVERQHNLNHDVDARMDQDDAGIQMRAIPAHPRPAPTGARDIPVRDGDISPNTRRLSMENFSRTLAQGRERERTSTPL